MSECATCQRHGYHVVAGRNNVGSRLDSKRGEGRLDRHWKTNSKPIPLHDVNSGGHLRALNETEEKEGVKAYISDDPPLTAPSFAGS